MSNPPDIKTTVNRFIEAFNSNDASVAPLAGDVVYGGVCEDRVFFDTRPLIQGSG